MVAEDAAALWPVAPPVDGEAARQPWTGDFRSLRLRLYLLMMATDCVILAGAFMLANLVRFGDPLEAYGLNTLAVLVPVYLAVGLNGGAFSIRALTDPRDSVGMAIRSLLFAIAVATALFFSLKIGEDFSRLVFGIGSVLALLMIGTARLLLGGAMGRRCGWTFRREILICDEVQASPAGTERLIDAEQEAILPDLQDPAMLQRIGAILDRCERVIIACPSERRSAWSRVLAGANVDVEILVPELDQVGAIGLRRHGSSASLLVGCGPLGVSQRAMKRIFDLVVAGAALLLLSPLLVAIAIAVRVDSPGPALFRQQRVGRSNRLFGMLKFRTMRVEASDADGARSASPGDTRVTRLGAFLRRTSLDELPQLLNVLMGTMSLVGPRPHPLGCTAEDELFWTIEDRYWDRHAVKPGMTGLAQVRGLRGATVRRSDLSDRLRSDLEYLEGWSVGRDIGILIRTVGVMIHRNAY